jgi:hypothetical protein
MNRDVRKRVNRGPVGFCVHVCAYPLRAHIVMCDGVNCCDM